MTIKRKFPGVAVCILLCTSNAQAATEGLSDKTLRSLLASQHPEDYRTRGLDAVDPKYGYFKQITVPSFRDGTFYRYSPIGPPGGEFVFFVDAESRKTAVLTLSAEGLGAVLRAQRDLDFGTLDQQQLSTDLLRLYHPYAGLLDTARMEATPPVKGMDLRIGKDSALSVSKDGKELALTWVLGERNDLLVVNLKASATGSVQITELVRVRGVFGGIYSH